MQAHLTNQPNLTDKDFYERLAKDCKSSLIQIVGEAGTGKTSSLRTIISRIQKIDLNIKWVIYDVSQAWFHNAPVDKRQLVTRERLKGGRITNEYDCVYEMGALSEDERRAFVGTCLNQHFQQRYQAKLEGRLKEFPTVCFVFEEANIYFGSYSFRRNDEYSQTFQMFASVGRNYSLRGWLVATVEASEISPSLRRRTRKLYATTIAEEDIRTAKKVGVTIDISKIPKYNFHYYGQTIHIKDEVNNTPLDFIRVPIEVDGTKKRFNLSWWIQFITPILVMIMFYLYFVE